MEQFEALIADPLDCVSEYVYILPASRAENHTENAGLLRLSIETACLAFRRADGKFLAGPASASTDIRNRERDRVWRYAAFVGGLLRPIGRCATLVEVSAVESQNIWNPFQEPLWRWMRRIECVQIRTQWRDRADGRPVQAASVWIAGRLLSPASLTYLASAGQAVPEMLLQLLAGERTGLIGEIVAGAFQTAIDQDLARISQARQVPITPMQIEHRLLEALRTLVREKWTLNAPGSRLWVTRQGVFIVWKPAANDLAVKLRAEGLSAAPRDPDTMAELLLSHGVLAANPKPAGAIKHYYKITPMARGVPKQVLEVVKVADAEIVGVNIDGIEAIDVELASNARADVVPVAQDSVQGSFELALQVSDVPEMPAVAAPADTTLQPTQSPLTARGTDIESDPLSRFGEAGKVLRALAERIRSDPGCVTVASIEGGLAVAYPEALSGLCERPQEFLASCEAQGLLVPDKAAGRRLIRTGPCPKVPIEGQYVIFAPRVSKHLALPTGR